MSEYLTTQIKSATRPTIPPISSAVLQRQSACGKRTSVGGECEECKQKREGKVQRAAINSASVNQVPPIAHEVLRCPGQPLEAETRAVAEPRFGHDFSNVRLHMDARAAESARAVGALAYTVGSDIVFGEGRYSPGTMGGRRLLAHELTHVIQQRRTWTAIAVPRGHSDEQEADRAASTVENGGSAAIPVMESFVPYVAREAASPPRTGGGSFAPAVFHPGVRHDHRPTGRWSDVQAASSCLRGTVECVCAHAEPRGVLMMAYLHKLDDLGRRHLIHFVRGGGADLTVDLENVIRRDVGVRAPIAYVMSSANRGWVTIEQRYYDVQEFQYALGAIDRLDFEVDTAAGLVHLWFKDRYEFHPVGFGYTSLPGDIVRDTNCVHAAAVELKASGAADYWMVGEAVVPLSLFAKPLTYSFGKSERIEGEAL